DGNRICHVEISGVPILKAQPGKGRIFTYRFHLSRQRRQLVLGPFLVDERVVDFLDCGLYHLQIPDQGFLLHSISRLYLTCDSAGGKNRRRNRGRDGPYPAGTAKESREVRARRSIEAG